jgi:hypothetical protein
MYKALKRILPCLLLLVSVHYAYSQKSQSVYINEEKKKNMQPFKRIFLFAQAKDIQARVRLENALASSAELRGYPVVKSIDVIPPSLQDTALPSRDKVLKAIDSAGCDAVFAIRLLNKNDKINYKKGGVGYSKVPIIHMVWRFVWVLFRQALTTNTKDVYSNTIDYFILSSLYEVSTQELIFSIDSDIMDPTDVDRFTKAYMADVLQKMENEKILRKKACRTKKLTKNKIQYEIPGPGLVSCW